jgi:hypothetical protein
MLDHIAYVQPGTRALGLVDGSARPDAPVVTSRERARLETRARARLAAGLHRVASALEPHPRREQAVATTACR